MSSSATQDVDRSPSERVDVCIVGAGVAGALVAYSLAQSGYEVILLEAGERFDRGDRLQRMERDIRPSHDGTSVWEMGGKRDRYTSSGEEFYPLNGTRVKGVGGTTLHWLGMAGRLHEKDFEMQSRYGLASDWPISYADLQPYYATAEEELGVAGREGDNPFAPPRENAYPMEAFPFSYSDTMFMDVCERLGIATHSAPQARNTEQYDGRSPCLGYSTCIKVCPSGAKYSGDVHVEKAEQEGVRVIDRASVQSLEHDADGSRIEAAVYATPNGETYRQPARQFVVACGAVETARLLLLSKSETYPDGLANSSGVVGRYFMEHPSVGIDGEIDQQTNQNPIGFYTMESQQFYDHEASRPGSFTLVFENRGATVPMDMALSGGDSGVFEDLSDVAAGDRWGDALFDAMQEDYSQREVGLEAAVEQLPRKENTVTLDRTKTDDHGNPVPEVSWNLGAHERKTMERSLNVQREVLTEMDAEITSVRGPDNPGHAGHHMGTTRMSNDPGKGVVDSRLRTHDVGNLTIASGSVFVTGGAVPPTLTIAALSLKAAEHIDDSL
jgi:choline dehydrogenase-like flavoprotein